MPDYPFRRGNIVYLTPNESYAVPNEEAAQIYVDLQKVMMHDYDPNLTDPFVVSIVEVSGGPPLPGVPIDTPSAYNL
jgi:hypothetical protein